MSISSVGSSSDKVAGSNREKEKTKTNAGSGNGK